MSRVNKSNTPDFPTKETCDQSKRMSPKNKLYPALSKIRISAIVPVYREQDSINHFLRSLQAVFHPPDHEIIVVDGSPEGETISAVHFSEIRTLHSAPGRGTQMNSGAAAARGRILVFVHADTYLPWNASQLIIQALQHRNTAAGAFSLGIDSRRYSLSLVAEMANLRSRWSRVPYGDQAIFMYRDFFFQLGGFQEIPLMEDLDLMHRIRKKGRPIRILSPRAWTSPRRWEREGVLRATLRNWMIRILYHCGLPPEVLKKLYPLRRKTPSFRKGI